MTQDHTVAKRSSVSTHLLFDFQFQKTAVMSTVKRVVGPNFHPDPVEKLAVFVQLFLSEGGLTLAGCSVLTKQDRGEEI